MMILEDHLRGCVSDAIRRNGDKDSLITQVVDVFGKFGR